MSRPTGKSLKQASADGGRIVVRIPYANYLVRKILGLSRILRIVITGIFSVALTAAVFPLIDEIYITRFFDERTRILPSFVAVAIGIIMYGVGWYLLIGTRGEDRPQRIAVLFYVLAGICVLLFVSYLIINGYSLATMPDA